MARKRFSEKQVIMTLACQGVVVPCFRCKEPLIALPDNIGDRIEREHILEIALGGEDIPANCRFSHSRCHHVVTNGTKATSAGSSKHRIAKVDRLVKGPRQRKGRAIQSRGFQERKGEFKWPKRKMAGGNDKDRIDRAAKAFRRVTRTRRKHNYGAADARGC